MDTNGDIDTLVEQAKQHLEEKDFTKADQVFEDVLTREPGHLAALAGRAKALRKLGKAAEAQELLTSGLKLHPASEELIAERVHALLDVGMYDPLLQSPEFASLAIKLVSEEPNETIQRFAELALVKFPESIPLLDACAYLWMKLDKFDESEELHDKILKMDGANQQAMMSKFLLMRMEKRAESAERVAEARRLAEQVVEFATLPEILIQCGRVFEKSKDYDKAIAAFIKADNEKGYDEAVRTLYMKGSSRDAEELVTKVLDRFTDSADLHNWRAAFYADQTNYVAAIEEYEKVLKLDENNMFAHRFRIAALRMLGRDRRTDRLSQAENMADELLNKFPQDGGILLERGWLFWERDQFDKADEAFRKALELDATLRKEIAFARVDALTKMNRVNEARQILEDLQVDFPHDPIVMSNLGWFYLGRNEFFNARTAFEKIPETLTDGLRDNGLGGVEFSQGKYDEAAKWFRRSADANPKDPTFHTNLAWALVRQGADADLVEAEARCRTALAGDSGFARAYGCLGVIAFKRGRLRESEDYLRESIRVNEKDGNYTDLGALYVQMARYEEAEAQLKKALNLNRDDGQATIELGNVYLLSGKIKEAVIALRQAVAIDSRNAEAHRALAIALMRADDLSGAERVLRNAIKRLDEDKRWTLHLMLAQLLIRRGDDTDDGQFYEEALIEVNKVIKLQRSEPEPYFYKGVIRYKLGDYYRGWKSFKDCLSRDKDHYEAERNARLVRTLIVKEKGIQLGSIIGAVLLGTVSLGQLIVMWVLHLKTDAKVSEKMLIFMIPILLGLFVIAFLLPGLVKLKLPGLEAELSQPRQKDSISSGPKGDVGVGATPSISSGPR